MKVRTSGAAVVLPWSEYCLLRDRLADTRAFETFGHLTPGSTVLLVDEIDKGMVLAAIDAWLTNPMADPPAGDGIRRLRLALVAEPSDGGEVA